MKTDFDLDFDVLVAQGTHPSMSTAQKLSKIGNADFRRSLFDHRWDDADELITCQSWLSRLSFIRLRGTAL